tara:strand:- start:1365 stop:3248 length:1884 start_codon:yes stop_codon:yes gene_type:complete
LFGSQIGYYSLILGLLSSILLIPLSVTNLKDEKKFDSKIFSITFLQFLFVTISFLGLIASFIVSDFSNETVYNNSHTSKPLFYKISGTWGNHEGSLLLWLLVLTLFIFLFLIQSKDQPKKYKIFTLLFQQIIIIGFFIFVLKTSSPFNFLFPVPKEGLGLNPILQDPALAIHPPILYLGYVGSSIIFSASLAAVIQRQVNKHWAQSIKFWVLLSWVFLTLGIMLGSIWAYYELGWGGFWFWDPVENVSLMPWLCLTALLHCIIVLEKKLLLNSWVIILSISTFILSMSGTFLVRSGILNSVHTFANDPERGVFILIFLFALIFLSLLIFFVFHKEESIQNQKFFFLSKETSILINNWFVMYFLGVILIGTVYPIFLDIISDEKISVGPPFYNKLLFPFLIPFLIFMAVGPNLNWIKSERKKVKNRLLGPFLISLIFCLIIYYNFSLLNLVNSILLLATFYLFYTTARDFFINRFKNISQSISHFGFSLLVLSILLNSIFSTEVTANLKVGDKYNFNNGSIIFSSLKRSNGSNYESLIGNFIIKNSENEVINLKPEIRIYNQPITITSEADIKTSLYSDKFIVMNKVNDNDFFNVRYQVKPFMIWIWMSGIIISIGGIFTFLRKAYEK